MRPKPLPTQGELLDAFSYDPESGLLRTKIRLAQRVPANTVVGSLSTTGYLKVSYRGQSYAAHRIIWKMVTGEEPEVVDHINFIRTDNRICNLRSLTYSENNFHRKTPRRHTKLKNGRYRVSVRGKDVGYFDTWEEADAAHKEAREALCSL
jgi:hypothetical protein